MNKLRPSIYRKAIMEACKVSAEETSVIEDAMRDAAGGILDNIDRKTFDTLARNVQKALKLDPELRAAYK